MVKLENILFATDFSKSADNVLQYAASLAQLYNTKLYLLHVIRNPTDSIYGELHGEYPALIAGAKKKVAELMKRYDAELQGVPHEIVVKEGDPVYEILRTANEEKIGTVVIGTHGEGPLEHLLIGGTADKVIRSASCPVLVIRHPDHRAI